MGTVFTAVPFVLLLTGRAIVFALTRTGIRRPELCLLNTPDGFNSPPFLIVMRVRWRAVVSLPVYLWLSIPLLSQ